MDVWLSPQPVTDGEGKLGGVFHPAEAHGPGTRWIERKNKLLKFVVPLSFLLGHLSASVSFIDRFMLKLVWRRLMKDNIWLELMTALCKVEY